MELKHKNKNSKEIKYLVCNSCSDIDIYNEEYNCFCFKCGTLICNQCYIDFDGYCNECFDTLQRENEEMKRELWCDFWSSRF